MLDTDFGPNRVLDIQLAGVASGADLEALLALARDYEQTERERDEYQRLYLDAPSTVRAGLEAIQRELDVVLGSLGEKGRIPNKLRAIHKSIATLLDNMD